MKTAKKKWKVWLKRILFILLLLFSIWIVNLIWFKPFSIANFYDREFIKLALEDPELVSTLGIPVLGDLAKNKLTDESDQHLWTIHNVYLNALKTLEKYNFEKQSPANKLNTRILSSYLQLEKEREPFMYHHYSVCHFSGTHISLPRMMEDDHVLENKDDLEDYITRLSKFNIKIDQVVEGLRIREEMGIIPPLFSIQRTIDNLKKFLGEGTDSVMASNDPVRENMLYRNVENKIKNIQGLQDAEIIQYEQRVADEIEDTVFPAYDKLIDYLEILKNSANNEAGVWKLPNGQAYYAHVLKENTTTNYTPEQIHTIGLNEVERIKSELWKEIYKQGFSDSTVSLDEAWKSIQKNVKRAYLFRKPNEPFETTILNEYSRLIDEIDSGIAPIFDIRPKARLTVKQVPSYYEGSSPAFYVSPPQDGSREGIFYVPLKNLDDVDSVSRSGMKRLACHEGIPGHHFQIGIQSELQNVPIFRTVIPFAAFIEGWAMYAEQLAWEEGFFDDDPLGNVSRLFNDLTICQLLVVDTGIHYKRWSRDESIDYLVNEFGWPIDDATQRVDRSIVNPGQFCSYKIGMMKILALREHAKSQLGESFTLKEFHNVVLRNGTVPLHILEDGVDEWISQKIAINP